MEVFLIDSPDQKKQDRKTKFLTQAVNSTVELVPLEHFSQETCRLIAGICCIWVVFSKKLPLYPGIAPLEFLSQNSCLLIGRICSTSAIFWDILSPYYWNLGHLGGSHRQAVSSFWLTFSLYTIDVQVLEKMIDSSRGILLYDGYSFLWLVFPFLEVSIKRKNSLVRLATIFLPLFQLQCYS